MRIQLTKKIVTSTLPKDRPYELRDAQVRGLLLRVQPSGHRAWIVTWAHGKRRTLGSVEHLSLDQARDVARKVVAEFVQTGLPSIAKPEPVKITLRAFLDNHYAPWIKTELKRADDTLRRIEQAFAALLPMTLTDIDAKVIERWWLKRLSDTIQPGSKQTISKATASRNLATLRSAMSKAVKWGMLETNPVTNAALKVAKPRSVVRFLSTAEEHRLRSALTARDNAHAAARKSANQWRTARKRALLPEAPEGAFADHLTPIVLLAMNTGLRKGELLSLNWSDINLQARMLTVRAEHAKSGKQRHVPLNNEAMSVLQRWRPKTSGSGTVFGISSVKSSWEKLIAVAKINDFRFHDLRHHFASRLVMTGVDLNTIRELLGHADLTMTLRYAHLAPQHLAAAVAKLC
ncbi:MULTISPECIES: tyrosine-type recombinase/integrase [Pseudoxanthomonas]|uniref:Integrase n=1 Tax=Pseudoxanthomonas winnipegensis TaxID=2480810 RepID=A0AAW8GCC0_9GAMM|nr:MULTISPECIES: tyrosine-type recombinase/integrase [Pseudoxanthomonas]MDQ1118905.1 integrase [Pseudoxanthomonas winnipegensis]MDQ1132093.1 integrase [Pseudoxanthomonas winnipegensis]MDR6137894.1 integrase [Pseudoxanthomonas sp. SORGH_AS_0997]